MILDLWVINIMLHYSIHGFLTHEIFSSEVASMFSFYLRVMKTQLFANI